MSSRGRLFPFAAVLAVLLACAPRSTRATPGTNQVSVGDLPGTGGDWQAGEVIVEAPPELVQRWLADVASWPRRFPDVEWAEVAGRGPDGRMIARFRSRLVGRVITLRLAERPGHIFWDGEGKDVTTQGKIFIARLDERRTRVIMQTTAQVHGAAGLFATRGMKRGRALRKLSSDLSSLVRLSGARAEVP